MLMRVTVAGSTAPKPLQNRHQPSQFDDTQASQSPGRTGVAFRVYSFSGYRRQKMVVGPALGETRRPGAKSMFTSSIQTRHGACHALVGVAPHSSWVSARF